MNLQKILDALNCGNRLSLFSELTSRKDAIRKDKRFPETYRQIKSFADTVTEEGDYELNFQEFTSFHKTGLRDGYSPKFVRKRKYLCSLGFMALFDEDEKYVALLENLMWSYCNEYSWVDPAHIGELTKPDYESNRMVDLTASELALALSEISFLLADKLEPFLIQRIKKEVDSRIFQPILRKHKPFNWQLGTTNWTAVCGGCSAMAAIYLMEDNVALASILEILLESLEKYPKSFYSDGTCREGLGYWSYGLSNFLAFSELLRQRTNGEIDMMKCENMDKISGYLSNCILYKNYVVNFSDCEARFVYPEGIVHKLKDIYPEVEVPDCRYVVSFDTDPLGRWNRFIRDIAWRREEYREHKAEIHFTKVFEDAEWLYARKQNGNNTICFVAKGGNNNESHNHNDIGTFLYYIDDNPFFIDMGSGKYDKNYFSERRYESIYAASLGHSVPIVGRKPQCAGENYEASCFEFDASDEKAVLKIGIDGAYNNAKGLLRSFEINEDGSVILTDAFESLCICERFVVVSVKEPKVSKGKITLYGESCNAEILFDAESVNEINITEADGFFSKECQQKYFVDFIPEATGEFQITLRKSDK